MLGAGAALRGRTPGRQGGGRSTCEALRRGCKRSFLETFSFQALPFYQSLGYTVLSRLDDFPIGGARYALTKDLDVAG